MAKKNILLGEFLVEQGIITKAQLHQALKYHHDKGVRLGRALIELGLLTEKEMIDALSEQLGVEYVNLKTYRIDKKVLALVPEQTVRNYQAMPLFQIQDRLTVAMPNPLDVFAIDALTRATKLKIEPVVCSEQDLWEALETYYAKTADFSAPAGSTARGTRNQVVVVHSENERDNLIQEIDGLLDRLARQEAYRAFLVGRRLRVEMAKSWEDWPIPAGIDSRSFVRMLCNLAENTESRDRSPAHYLIDKKADDNHIRFHLLADFSAVAGGLTVFVQMQRSQAASALFDSAEYAACKSAIFTVGGVHIVCAASQREVDAIYYQLWEHATDTAKYPISIEARPTTLIPQSMQMVAPGLAERLAVIRFAVQSNVDALFIKDSVDHDTLRHMLPLVEIGATVLIALVAREPWRLLTRLFGAPETAALAHSLQSIFGTAGGAAEKQPALFWSRALDPEIDAAQDPVAYLAVKLRAELHAVSN